MWASPSPVSTPGKLKGKQHFPTSRFSRLSRWPCNASRFFSWLFSRLSRKLPNPNTIAHTSAPFSTTTSSPPAQSVALDGPLYRGSMVRPGQLRKLDIKKPNFVYKFPETIVNPLRFTDPRKPHSLYPVSQELVYILISLLIMPLSRNDDLFDHISALCF